MSVGLLSSDLILDRLQALAKVTEHTAVFCLLILHRCWKMRLDVLFLLKKKVVAEVCFVIFKWNEDLVCPDLSRINTTFTLVNAWSGLNRGFILSLSCEWGCTIPSTNDRGSQAPTICPRGAKN